ncbi:hypothetical protein ABEV55_19295, partial [Aneurinibacillus thermoaerophilus]
DRGKTRGGMLILGTTILFLGLVIFMVDLIQDYLNNEFEECNTIIVALIPLLFDSDWNGIKIVKRDYECF